MPITGEFLSDFTAFIAGAKDADKAVEGLEKSGGELGTAFSDSLSGLNIQSMLSDPLGEASRVASGFVEFLPPMVQGVVAAAAAIAGMATASFALADAAADVGENLGDMAAKTGATVPEMSALSNAATVAGVDLGLVSTAMFNMNKTMAEHPTEFAENLRAIGINAQQFADMRADEKFFAVVRGLEGMTDASQKTKIGSDLLGRSYQELSGDLGDLLSAQQDVAGMDIWTTAQAAKAAEFNAAVAKLKLEFQQTALAVGRDLIPMMTEAVKAFGDSAPLKNYETSLSLVRAAWDELDTRVRTWTGTMAATAPPVEGANQMIAGLTATVQANSFALESGATTTERTATGMKRLADMAKEDEEATRKAAAEQKKFAEAMSELNAAGEGFKGTLAGINGNVVEAIKYYLDAGVAQGTLATAYGLTAVEIKAVASAMKEEQDAAKETQKILEDTLKAQTDAQREYDRAVREGSNDTTQAQIANIWKVADEQINALAQQGTLSEQAWDAIIKTAETKIATLTRKTLEQDKGTRQYYQNMRDDAAAAYDFALAHAEDYTQGRIDQLRQEAEAADRTLADWRTAAEAALTGVKGAADQARDAIKNVNDETAKAADAANGLIKNFGGFDIPRAVITEGGVVRDMFGRPVAGGIGLTNLPKVERPGTGGFYSPAWGNVGGGYGPVNVNVNGAVLGTQDELARLIGDSLTSSYRSGGNRLPA